ncbi:MAG: hypothetical protein AAFR54_19310 [Planctomycetota bacterium]
MRSLGLLVPALLLSAGFARSPLVHGEGALSGGPSFQHDEPIVVETHHDDGSTKERFVVDDNGRKDGAYERFRPDGSLEVRASYRDDAPHGIWQEFDESDLRTVEGNFRHGTRDGFWRTFVGDVTTLEARYKNGDLHGDWRSSTPDGSHLVRGKYVRGELHGRWLEERPATRWERTAKYVRGELDGKARIRVRGKTVSKRRWKKGVLIELDGRVPYPVPESALRGEIEEALASEETDGAEPRSDEPDDALRRRALARLKAYRALCQLPWRDITLVPEWNELCRAAAEVLEANGELSHTPPKPPVFDEERYRQGYEGANKSNIHFGPGGVVSSIDFYMDDSDAKNIDSVGHRRWCLNPAMGRTGFGRSGVWSAMWAMDASGNGVRGRKTVLYPPDGFVPADLFGPRYAWSVQFLDGHEPSEGRVDVLVFELDDYYQARGSALELDWNARAEGDMGNSPCYVFRPVGIVCAPGSRYGMEIRLDGGDTPDFEYLVEFVAPIRGNGEGR